jgi:hypothetical protein
MWRDDVITANDRCLCLLVGRFERAYDVSGVEKLRYNTVRLHQ